MPDATHPIAPRGLSPITELTTPQSLQPELPNDEPDAPHPSYASIREGGSDGASVYSHGSGGTVTPRARRTSLPRGFDLGPPLRPPTLIFAPSRHDGGVDSPLTLPDQISPRRKPFPSPSGQPGGLPPPPRRRGTPPPSPTRPSMTRPHSWQPRSRAGSGATIEEESGESHHSDEGPQTSLSSAGQAGIGARSNFEAPVDEVPKLETWDEVLSPASTLLAPRPSLRQSHSSPAMVRPLEPAIPSPPVPQVELLSQSLKVSPDATPPISPAGSQRSKMTKSANLLRKRAKSMNGRKTSPKHPREGSGDRPRSVLGTSTLRMGSNPSLGKRQPTPPRRGSSQTPTPQHSRPSSRAGSTTGPSIRTRKGSKSASRRSLVSSLFSLFDPSHRQRTASQSSPKRERTESSTTDELLGVEPQTAIRTSGTFGVRDDGSVMEDPNKSPRSLMHTRTRTESGPALSALSAATSGMSGNGSARSMGVGRVLYVQNLEGRQSEERSEARESMETLLGPRKRVPSMAFVPPVPALERPAITSSPEQTVAEAIPVESELGPPSNLPRPMHARRDISKGSSTSDHTFGGTSPPQIIPSPERRDASQVQATRELAFTPGPTGGPLPLLDLSRAAHPGSGPSSARASPTRPLPRPPAASPRVSQAPPVALLNVDTPHDLSDPNRPLSIISNQGSESITPRASIIPPDLRDSLHIPGPYLNIPGPPSVSPSPSRESSWYAPAPDLLASTRPRSIASDAAEKDSPEEEGRQPGPRQPDETFQSPGNGEQARRDQARHSHESHTRSRHSHPRIPQLPGLAASAPGSSTDLPFLIASHVVSTHAAQLMQHSTDMQDVSEAIRRMAKESLDWGGMLMRLSEESRTTRPAGQARQRPISMPQSIPPGLDNLRELLERMRTTQQAPPVPDLPDAFRFSTRPPPACSAWGP